MRTVSTRIISCSARSAAAGLVLKQMMSNTKDVWTFFLRRGKGVVKIALFLALQSRCWVCGDGGPFCGPFWCCGVVATLA